MAASAASKKEPYKVGAVFDITGTGSPLGTPERDTALMLEKQINAHGGINGHPLKLIIYDNASEETKSMMAVKRLIESDKVLAIIGPSQTGTTLSTADTVRSASIPMVSCAAGVRDRDPVNPWIFKTAQSDVHAVAKVIDYLKALGVKQIAVISVSNAFGESGKQQARASGAQGRNQDRRQGDFGSDDKDMTPQLMRISRAHPRAIVCWGTNPGPAMVARNMKMLGRFRGIPLIMSHGIANRKFIELAGDAANGIVFPAGKLLVAKSIRDSDPQKKVLLGYESEFEKAYSRKADTFGGHAFDALNVVCNALAKSGADRSKLRAEIEKEKRYVGISGVFNFTPKEHNGLAKDAFVMVRITNGNWAVAR